MGKYVRRRLPWKAVCDFCGRFGRVRAFMFNIDFGVKLMCTRCYRRMRNEEGI